MNRPSTLQFVLKVSVFLSATSIFQTTADAQDWHIGNPPVTHSVPQYRATYPLHDGTSKQTNPHTSFPKPVSGAEIEPTVGLNPILPVPSQAALPSTEPADIRPAQRVDTTVSPGKSLDLLESSSSVPFDSKRLGPNGVDYSIHRSWDSYPVDPRKPCNDCTRPPAVQPQTSLNLPGLRGRPYQEREPGGCLCGKKNCPKCNEISVNWPAPFSTIHDRHHASSAELRDSACQPRKFNSAFDGLADAKLVPYKRRDNGYCGWGSDPYGCLGESRQASHVSGVQFRNPGNPAAVPAPFNR